MKPSPSLLAWVGTPSLVTAAANPRIVFNLDHSWGFQLIQGDTGFNCSADSFDSALDDVQCLGLVNLPYVDSPDGCRNECCGDDSCKMWQWCSGSPGDDCGQASCWTGNSDDCSRPEGGWQGEGREVLPPAPAPTSVCNETSTPQCGVSFDDSSWRVVDVPHDFVVEGAFSESADMSHGYLPYGKAWYRKHFVVPEYAETPDSAVFLDFDGVMVNADVYLNGAFLGHHAGGYTPFRFEVTSIGAPLTFGADNVIAVFVDATTPDSWWYDGGGIYRHVWMTVVPDAGCHFSQFGLYAPSLIVGEILAQTDTSPAYADAFLTPEVTIKNSNSSMITDAPAIDAVVTDPSGSVVANVSGIRGNASISPQGELVISFNVSIQGAELWSIEWPSLYKLSVSLLTAAGDVVDQIGTNFGIRKLDWDSDMGFYLNDQRVKIKGCANHQDFAGLGVAVPDSLQAHRIAKLQEVGSNGWRTAHNPPSEALLDFTDSMGMLVWDENHRNGETGNAEVLVRRDRNHPSVIVWSICNEVLCDSGDGTLGEQSLADAEEIKAIFKRWDPRGQRVISANQNDWIYNGSVLELLG